MNLDKLNDQIDKLSLRERVIVLAAVLLVLYGLWYLFWFGSALAERDASEARLQTERTEQQQLQQQIDTFRQLASGQALQSKRAELQAAEQRLASIDAQLAELTNGLIRADQLARVLQDVLTQTASLTLLELVTEPVTRVSVTDASAAAEASAQDQTQPQPQKSAGVYRHSVKVTVSGRYFDVLDLIRRLESLEWRFYWESLHYEVIGYPNALVIIRVYTLSAEEGRLGV